MKQIYFPCLLLLLWTLSLSTYAQKMVSGKVTDDEGPVAGVSVGVKGTVRGTQTNANGNYSIHVSEGEILRFSFLGYLPGEVMVGTAATIDVILEKETGQLDEVVVTALGIRRERKSLGYALQEVKGEDLVRAGEPNITNALIGKVAGLQVARSSNGPAGSSKIVLRGSNSLKGDNQPLIVVDGIPIDNFTGTDNNDYWNPGRDMGNGLGDMNPDDIAAMSVLKGPSAAALYGSRAGNGVILITTKTGSGQKGAGISYSNTVSLDKVFILPDMQTTYGQGTVGAYDKQSALSWGPRIEGQSVEKWDGSTVPLQAYDNMGNYFNTGVSVTQNLTFQQQLGGTSVYTSLTHMGDRSRIPETGLSRTNLLARAVSKPGKDSRWTTDTKVQYIRLQAKNRPVSGHNDANPFMTMNLLPRSLDVRDFKDAKRADGRMLWFGSGNQLNPYWARQYDLNEDTRDRFLMAGSVRFDATDWLFAEARAGTDLYTTNMDTRMYAGAPAPANGRYSQAKETFNETNYSFLISAQRDHLFGRFGGAASLGGNLMMQKRTEVGASVGELLVPDFFYLRNSVNPPTIDDIYKEKQINSVYGTAQLSYDGYWFLDGTFRNDWTSTLIRANRSFFYPSVSTSLVFTEMISRSGGSVPAWLSYGKVRASYARVGNDMGSYETNNNYEIGLDPNGNTTATRKEILYDPNVKNELVVSWEAGLEARFVNGRFGLDVALYKSNATNQLIDLPMDPMSGYRARRINAGNIENKGIEVMLDARIFNNPETLIWDLNVNFSRNLNTVLRIAEGVGFYPLGGFDKLTVFAEEGAPYGVIYGSTLLRVDDINSSHYGKLLLNADGLPQENEAAALLGGQQPDALLGFTNNFGWRGLALSFQFDARLGGELFSATNQAMQQNGTAAATAPGGRRESVVVDGVVADGDGFRQNDKAITAQQYWESVVGGGNLGIIEANVYDATHIRLRNIQLSYKLPSSFLARTPVQRAQIGLSCNNVWMIRSHLNGVDPESVFATNTNATGFENRSAPTSRTLMFNLSVGF